MFYSKLSRKKIILKFKLCHQIVTIGIFENFFDQIHIMISLKFTLYFLIKCDYYIVLIKIANTVFIILKFFSSVELLSASKTHLINLRN